MKGIEVSRKQGKEENEISLHYSIFHLLQVDLLLKLLTTSFERTVVKM